METVASERPVNQRRARTVEGLVQGRREFTPELLAQRRLRQVGQPGAPDIGQTSGLPLFWQPTEVVPRNTNDFSVLVCDARADFLCPGFRYS